MFGETLEKDFVHHLLEGGGEIQGLQFPGSYFSSFLKIGVTFALLQSSGSSVCYHKQGKIEQGIFDLVFL